MRNIFNFREIRWVVGLSEWLAGENGSKEKDKQTYGYLDQECIFIYA